MIGIARRFAPYKRADLILTDLERLDRIVNHPHRPVHLVFAGKAHPNDGLGKNLVEKVLKVCRDERFRGRIFFLENYDIRVARHLVQGVDLWLNNPRRPLEASGTSGIKVVINGVLNMSVSDGWWVEGYNGSNGWTIGPVVRGYEEPPPDTDAEDAQSLYSLLENTVIPAYYDRDTAGLPTKWLAMVKQSMQSLTPQFNTDRMLQEYLRDMYGPASQRECELAADDYALARRLAEWKSKVPMRFSSLKLIDVSVEGIHGDTVIVDQPLRVSARIDPGKLAPEEILVEMVIGHRNGHDFIRRPETVPLELSGESAEGILNFAAEYIVKENGMYSYGIRVIPRHPDLASKLETGLILWG